MEAAVKWTARPPKPGSDIRDAAIETCCSEAEELVGWVGSLLAFLLRCIRLYACIINQRRGLLPPDPSRDRLLGR